MGIINWRWGGQSVSEGQSDFMEKTKDGRNGEMRTEKKVKGKMRIMERGWRRKRGAVLREKG